MIDLGDFKNSQIFRTSCVVMTSAVSFMASCGELQIAAAGWPAFPAGRKSASGDTAKTPKGFAATIQKMLDEAKQFETRGDFDQAIAIAERANLIAEKTKDLNKSSPELSPAATARYVSELKQKKTEARNKKWQIARREPKRPAPRDQVPLEEVDSVFDTDIGVKSDLSMLAASQEMDFPVTTMLEPSAPSVSAVEPEMTEPEPSPPEELTQTKALPKPRFLGQEFVDRKAEPLPVAAMAFPETHEESSQPEAPRTIPLDDDDVAPKATLNSQFNEGTSPSKSIYDLLEDEVQFVEPTVRHPLNESPQELPKAPVIEDDLEIRPAQLETQDTVVSSVSQAIEDELAVSRAASKSIRIQLRPRFGSMEQMSLAKEFPEESETDSAGPTIESWDDVAHDAIADAPLPFDPTLDEDHIRPVAATWEQQSAGLASIQPEPATTKGRNDTTQQLEEHASKDERPWYDNSEDDFPARRVHELKQRLESALSLRPGDVSKSATIDLLSERLIREAEEDGFAEPSIVQNENDSPNEDSLFEADDQKSGHSRVINGHISTRTPIVGRTSMIRWRAASSERDGLAAQNRTKERSPELPLDLRQALREGAQLETLTESGTRSLFSLPTVKLRSASSAALTGSVEDSSERSAESTLSARTEVRGSLWDNAIAPTVDGYSGSIVGRPDPRKVGVENLDSAPLPPPSLSVAQTSFDSIGASKGQLDQVSPSNQSPVLFDSAARSEVAATSIDPKMDSSRKGLSVKKASLKTRQGANDDHATASSQALLLNGPIERMAFVFGISTSTASTILGIIGLTMVISGLWTVRAIVRSSLK